jgi:hypothetical protein
MNFRKLTTLILIILALSGSNSFSKSKKFEINGFSLGMVLADKLSTSEIAQGKYENYYNTKYITTLEFPKSSFLPNYDWIQFSFKKKDKKQKIIDIQVVNYYKDNIAECFAERDNIIAELKEKLKKKIDYIDEVGTKPFTKAFGKKGTNTVTWIILKGKKYVYVSCYNYAETESAKDQLRMGISNSYFDKMAFKK